MTVQNPCLSGGAIEVFLEPVVPAPRVLVVGETPIAGAVVRIGAELGLDVVHTDGTDGAAPRAGDLALVVAAHGRDELVALRRALEAGVPYVGLVASRARGDGVLGELKGDGVPEDLLARIDVPAGPRPRARRPRPRSRCRSWPGWSRCAARAAPPAPPPARTAPAATAVDPVCGMTVAAVEGTPVARARGRDGLVLLRRMPGRVRGAAPACRRLGLTPRSSRGSCSAPAGPAGSAPPSRSSRTATARCWATSSGSPARAAFDQLLVAIGGAADGGARARRPGRRRGRGQRRLRRGLLVVDRRGPGRPSTPAATCWC